MMRVNSPPKTAPRDRLLNMARVYFARHGLSACTDAEIEAAAGVPAGALQATFGSQARLFQVMILSDQEQRLSALRTAATGSHDPGAQVRALLSVSLQQIRELVGLVGAAPDIYAELKAAAGRANARHIRVVHQMLTEVLRHGWHSGHLVLDSPERAATAIQMRLLELQTEAVLGVTRLRVDDEAARVERLLADVVQIRERPGTANGSSRRAQAGRRQGHG